MEGPYEPTWESLAQYGEAPEWFRDVKFGIWSHWGPQCQPGQGDWYAREMYMEGSRAYNWHVENYGHPSEFGFKDVINEWKADQWNPEELMEGEISSVSLVGSDSEIKFNRNAEGLVVELPEAETPNEISLLLKIL